MVSQAWSRQASIQNRHRLVWSTMTVLGQTRNFLLGGRTSASAECRHWSGRAVRWSSCAILLSCAYACAAVAFALGETVELQDHVDAVGHHQRLDPAAQAAERERDHRRPQSLPM